MLDWNEEKSREWDMIREDSETYLEGSGWSCKGLVGEHDRHGLTAQTVAEEVAKTWIQAKMATADLI